VTAKRFLEIDDLTSAQVGQILESATKWKADPHLVPSTLLAGHGVAALFEKPSLRTRTSFELAVATLGGHPITFRADEVGLNGRESVPDVARTLASLCRVVAARVFDHAVLEQMAAAVDVPVVNLLSDRAHPCQALADLLTLRECWGTLEGRRLAYVGDGNNMAASLALAAALTGVEMAIASPPGFELPEPVVTKARNLGGTLDLVAAPDDAVRDAHAVYTDVWTSMGQEDETEKRRTAFEGYRIDAGLMASAEPGALFLHCLPAHRGEEVADEVLDGPASVVWQQAANRMHAARALLVELVA
jgi:ornithine carbamoyltransferase